MRFCYILTVIALAIGLPRPPSVAAGPRAAPHATAAAATATTSADAPPSGAATAGAATISAQLAAYYVDPAHYRAIAAEVSAWHRTAKNSCVAYAATALWHIGAPLAPTTVYDGELASRLLRPFAGWLAATYVTERIEPQALRAGDLVFAGSETAPTHVYVFVAWKHRKRQLAQVVDNQGRLYVRPVRGNRARYSPFGFALRLVRLR